MSGIVVAIGYVLLIPAFIGIAWGVTIWIMMDQIDKDMGPRSIERMREASVPESIVERVIAGREVPDDELTSLNSDQRVAVRVAQQYTGGSVTEADFGSGLAKGMGFFIAFGSFVGGLLGWLLVMKKRVLQCDNCSAVVAAS